MLKCFLTVSCLLDKKVFHKYLHTAKSQVFLEVKKNLWEVKFYFQQELLLCPYDELWITLDK